MKLIAALAAAGYLYLIVAFGWIGLVAAALHIGAMLLFVKR